MKKKLIITESQYKRLVENINESNYDINELKQEVDYANQLLEKRGMAIKTIDEEEGRRLIYNFLKPINLTSDNCVQLKFEVKVVNPDNGEVTKSFNDSRNWCISGEFNFQERWYDLMGMIKKEDEF